MESLKIVIPSYKRADRVSTKKIVDGAILCVSESQYPEYARHNKDIEIVTHPDEFEGLHPKKEWIRKKFGDIFILDDDVKEFRRLYTPMGEPSKIKDTLLVRKIIEETAYTAKQAGAYLFGFNHNPVPTTYSGHQPFAMKGYVIGGATGLLQGSKLYWNEEMKLGTDYWISLLNAYHHRIVWKDMRYAFVFKDTFTNPGGIAGTRTVDKEKETFEYLRNKFGNALVRKRDTNLSKRKHKWQMSLNLPF